LIADIDLIFEKKKYQTKEKAVPVQEFFADLETIFTLMAFTNCEITQRTF
jgi:hypothetical protein